MKITVINTSPRKNGNTAALLHAAADGAREAGASVSFFDLYDIDFKGCRSCFYCKRNPRPDDADICVQRDALRPILEECMESDAVFLGSPIYFGGITGALTSFLERLVFPVTTYEKDVDTYYTGKKDFALFYTMNVPDALCERMYSQVFTGKERLVARFNGECLTYCATDTKQFDDYSKYLASRYDPEAKAERNRTQFPVDLENARRIGRRLASK